MKSSGLRSVGNRALYGIVAGTCVLIGIAALVLQFATRPGPRVAPAIAASTAAPVVAAKPMPSSAPVATATAQPALATATVPKPAAVHVPVPAPMPVPVAARPARRPPGRR